MTHCHHHHHHGHGDGRALMGRKLGLAVSVNMLLTFVQIASGIWSGSLSLIADALHNFSDAASLLIAMFAFHIANRHADHKRTFGYKRVETVAALINLTTLVLVSFYLVVEAFIRLANPVPINGWVVIIVAGIAFLIDAGTALLIAKEAKHNMNIRAAYLHNIADAVSSLAVMVSGVLILLYGWYISDAIMTVGIAAYILVLAGREFGPVINILLNGSPENLALESVIQTVKAVPGVEDIHHVHLWRLDEGRNAMEAHVVLSQPDEMDSLKANIKKILQDQFSIDHVTLEFETVNCGTDCGDHSH